MATSSARLSQRFGALHALLSRLRHRPAGIGPRPKRRYQPRLEQLEDRTVPSISFSGVPNWVAAGPAPNTKGQDENVPAETNGGPNAVSGAIEAIAVNPGNAKQVFVGGVNGGVWKTNDITANPVAWVPLTDQFPALEISALQFDPTDGSDQTVVAGIGNTSNIGTNLGPLTGLLKTTDGGITWTQLGNTATLGLRGDNVSAVGARGSTILVGVVSGTSPGMLLSTDGGTTFANISGINGLNTGRVEDLAGDPTDANRFYAVVGGFNGGVFRTDDLGATWTNVTNNANIATLLQGGLSDARLAVTAASSPSRVYLAIADNGQLGGRSGNTPIDGVFWTGDMGGSWTAMDLPQTLDASRTISDASGTPIGSTIVITTTSNHGYVSGDRVRISGVTGDTNANGDWYITVIDKTHFSLDGSSSNAAYISGGTAKNLQGINHGRQAFPNLTISADPSNANLVYIAGDRQDMLGGDSSIGANNFSGRIFRGDASVAAQGFGSVVTDATHQWTPLTNSGTASNSSPHADSRAMVIDNGQLLYSGDGGIFRESAPTGTSGDWFSVNGAPNGGNSGIQVTQFSSVISYDTNSDVFFGGAQDTGTPQQSVTGSQVYQDQTQGDGPFTAVDDLTTPGGDSHRYIGLGRADYNNANVNLGTGINLIPMGGVSGFTGFNSLVVSTVAPTSGNSTRIVIANGGNPGPGGTALFQSDNAGTATSTGAIVYTQITTGTGWGGVNTFFGIPALAVGGNLSGTANQDVIYAGSGFQVFLRSTSGGTLAATAAQPTGIGFIQSIAIDPNDWMTAYVTDGRRVFQTTDGGASWTNITGNLSDTNIHDLIAVDGTGANAGVTAVLVGETDGVFRMLTNASGIWAKYGQNFPNASVWGLQYSTGQDELVAGTSGRGAFDQQNVSASLFTANTQTAVEGASQTFNLGSFSDTVSGGPYSVDVNWGDGTPDTTFTVAAAGSLGTQTHTFGEEKTYDVTITVTSTTTAGDSNGESFPVTVSDPPVMSATVTVSAVEGAAFTGKTVATFVDPGGAEPNPSDPSGTLNNHYQVVSIDWGDGSPLDMTTGAIAYSGAPGSKTNPFTVNGNHTYGEEGTYTITTIINHEGVQTTMQNQVTVTDPPVVASSVPVFGVECRTLTVPVATFVDPGGAEPNPSDPSGTLNNHYQVVSIDWGDGTPLDTTTGTITYSGAPGSKTDPFTVTGTHAYLGEGTFTVTTTLNHEGVITVTTTTAIINDDIGLLLLDPTGSQSLMVTGNSSVTVTGNGSTPASGCGAVVVDSSDSRAAFLTGNATVTAEDIDVTGGVKTAGHATFSTAVDHEAPTSDPLGLGLPAAPATHFAAVHISKGTMTLSPGTYDGGIQVTGQAAVTLLPGVYYLNGGGFQVSGHGSVTDNGAGVLIVNAPAKPGDTISITGQASVSLTAPSSLPAPYAAYQGIVLFQNPASSNPIQFSGQSSVTLTGVAYVPDALVAIDGNANVTINAGAGTATLPPILGALIAYDLKVDGNGVLTINPDDPPSTHSAALVLTPSSSGGPVSLAADGALSNGGTGSAPSAALAVSAGGSAAGSTGPTLLLNGGLLQVIGNSPSLAPTAPSATSTSTARQAIVDPLFSVDWGGGMVSSLSDLLNAQRSEELFSHLAEVS